MNTRILVAAFIGAILFFLLGWLFYGIVAMNYLDAHSIQYAGMKKGHPSLLGLFVSGFAFTLLISIIFGQWASINTVKNGALAGITIFLLVSLSFDLNIWSMWNWLGKGYVIVDVLINSVIGAILGAIIAGILGYNKIN